MLSVSNALPVKNLNDLIVMAQKDPGKLSFGSSGVSGANHLSGEMFREQANIDIVHVPYIGGSQTGGGTPQAFGDFIRSETAKWAQVIKTSNITLQ